MSKETYEARHAELQSLLEARSRELTHDNKSIMETLERKVQDHDRADFDNHKEHEARLKIVEEWMSNQKGRQWALGVGVSLVAGLVATAIQVLFHIFAK